VGPYSPAIQVEAATRLVFCSGQAAVDPAAGTLVPGDAAEQTRRTLDNLEAVLAAGGMTFADVVKATVFLTDMKDFAAMNDVYGRRFPGLKPARSTVQVAALPLGARVEIELVAAG
jgi:2-iminobutanoate/2-iminopropanoate deaminase